MAAEAEEQAAMESMNQHHHHQHHHRTKSQTHHQHQHHQSYQHHTHQQQSSASPAVDILASYALPSSLYPHAPVSCMQSLQQPPSPGLFEQTDDERLREIQQHVREWEQTSANNSRPPVIEFLRF